MRFISDVAAYDKEAEGSGANKGKNVAEILRGYDMDDTRRETLFGCYSENMEKNPFHISRFERGMDTENTFYRDMSDAGKDKMRELLNDYEQDIDEGRELSEWKAKAFMAEQEAGIRPETYAMYRLALGAANVDEKGSPTTREATEAVRAMDGLTQQQRAYLYQSTNTSWKKNPFGYAVVSEYVSGKEHAINPVDAGSISSAFGPRSAPTSGASSWHKAIDIAASAGTPVKSVMSGKVVAVNKTGFGNGYGVYVMVTHENGAQTQYSHMQEGSADNVNVGDTVQMGQQIGRVGSTGTSTGPHLDMRAWVDNQVVDPLTLIPGYGGKPSGYVYEGSESAGRLFS